MYCAMWTPSAGPAMRRGCPTIWWPAWGLYAPTMALASRKAAISPSL